MRRDGGSLVGVRLNLPLIVFREFCQPNHHRLRWEADKMEQRLWELFFATGLPQAYLAIRGREMEERQGREAAVTAFRGRRDGVKRI